MNEIIKAMEERRSIRKFKFYAVPIRISLRYMLMSRCRAMRLFT